MTDGIYGPVASEGFTINMTRPVFEIRDGTVSCSVQRLVQTRDGDGESVGMLGS
jgi:hypothetical protein